MLEGVLGVRLRAQAAVRGVASQTGGEAQDRRDTCTCCLEGGRLEKEN